MRMIEWITFFLLWLQNIIWYIARRACNIKKRLHCRKTYLKYRLFELPFTNTMQCEHLHCKQQCSFDWCFKKPHSRGGFFYSDFLLCHGYRSCPANTTPIRNAPTLNINVSHIKVAWPFIHKECIVNSKSVLFKIKIRKRDTGTCDWFSWDITWCAVSR